MGEREGGRKDVEEIRVGGDYRSSYPLALLRSEVRIVSFFCFLFFLLFKGS